MSYRRQSAIHHTVAYVLPTPSSLSSEEARGRGSSGTPRHRLGVNSMKLDLETGILYSGGRDGLVVGWQVPTRAGDGVKQGGPNEIATEPSTALFSSQHHTDWINDLIVCQEGQSVFTASSDRTVKLWRPHQDPVGENVELVGYHTDFAKCLAYASTNQWLCSGGLDGKLHLWDVTTPTTTTSDPQPNNLVATLSDPTAPHASYYACAIGQAGRLVAGGSPDGIIRLWDPRADPTSGTSSHFTGHADSVRALLMSDDNRWILSASSDSTIKLWSLASQRCVKTYTMHSDPVWCLFSADPDLRQFYAGSRSGLVTKTLIPSEVTTHHHHRRSFTSAVTEEPLDLDDDDDDSNTVVVCREPNGITHLAATPDHTFLWTSTTKPSIQRWADVAPAEPGAGLGSLMTAMANVTVDTTTKLKMGSDEEEEDEEEEEPLKPIRSQPLEVIPGRPGLIKCHMLSNRRQLLTLDSDQHVALWDILQAKLLEELGPVDLDATFTKLNPMVSVPNWCTVDTKIGALTIRLDPTRCFDAEVYRDEVDLPIDESQPGLSADDQINLGRWVLKNLFHPLSKLPPPTPTPPPPASPPAPVSAPPVVPTPPQIPLPPIPGTRDPINITAPQPVLSHEGSLTSPFVSPLSGMTPTVNSPPSTSGHLATSTSPTQRQFSGSISEPLPRQPGGESPLDDYHSPPVSPTATSQPSSIHPPPPALASTGLMGRLRQFSVKKLSRSPDHPKHLLSNKLSITSPPLLPTPGIPLISPIRASPSSSPIQQTPSSGSPSSISSASSEIHSEPDPPPTTLTSEPDTVEPSPAPKPETNSSPPSDAIPVLPLPDDLTLILSEESGEVSSCLDIYSGTLGTQARDYSKLTPVLPGWISDCIFKDRIPVKEQPKIGFLLKPLETSGLSSLPSNARLLAGRNLRCKKLITFLWEKLNFTPDKLHALLKRRASGSPATSPTAASNPDPPPPLPSATLPPFTPENWIVLTCNDQPLEATMTLATIKQYLWRAGGDVTVTYDIQPRYSIPVKV